jgi:hypothetical protein
MNVPRHTWRDRALNIVAVLLVAGLGILLGVLLAWGYKAQ